MLLKKSARYLEGAHQPGKSGQHYNKGGQRGAYTCMEMLSIFYFQKHGNKIHVFVQLL